MKIDINETEVGEAVHFWFVGTRPQWQRARWKSRRSTFWVQYGPPDGDGMFETNLNWGGLPTRVHKDEMELLAEFANCVEPEYGKKTA